MSFESDYRDLLIKQYWDKPRARSEIEMKASTWRRVFEWQSSFIDEFDIDQAYGDRLDIIGRIVGIDRIVPFIIPKLAFGFDDNPNARGFQDKFSSVANVAPFADKFERAYTDLQLSDPVYQFFIKGKIARNIGSPYMVGDDGRSIQEVVQQLFENQAYVIDNHDMSLSLYVAPDFDTDQLNAIVTLGLLPKPQGVRYLIFTQAAAGETFGFSDNPDALGFANKFDLVTEPGGRFTEKVFI